MKMLINVVSILLFSVMATAAVADAELESFKKEIRAKYDLKEKGYATNDIDLIVNNFYWSDTAVSTGEGFEVYEGRAAMYKLFEPVIKYTVKISSVHTYVNGHMGYDWCDYYVYDEDKKTPFEKYRILFLWERINGEWFVKGDMYVYGTFDNPIR